MHDHLSTQKLEGVVSKPTESLSPNKNVQVSSAPLLPTSLPLLVPNSRSDSPRLLKKNAVQTSTTDTSQEPQISGGVLTWYMNPKTKAKMALLVTW